MWASLALGRSDGCCVSHDKEPFVPHVDQKNGIHKFNIEYIGTYNI